MSVMLTEKAAHEVKKIITEQKLDPATVLRVGVAGGGCSGFQYSLGFDTAFDPKADTRTEQHGVAVVVALWADVGRAMLCGAVEPANVGQQLGK